MLLCGLKRLVVGIKGWVGSGYKLIGNFFTSFKVIVLKFVLCCLGEDFGCLYGCKIVVGDDRYLLLV